ncbi:MAG TPA: ABC transporter ATP-binding protein [Thermomicrobiaceae bacterium]|nr:ABC transporter ATP-binding protein [Thermomicrobiaceae bacterium]
MRQHGLQMMASAPQERARDRRATVRRLLGELHGYGREIVVVLLLIIVSAGAQAAGPWLISRAIDQHILRHDLGGLSRLMVILFVVYVSGSLANRAQIRRIGAISQSILAGLRQQIFDRLERLPLSYFDRRPVGDLMSRVLNDVDTLNQLFSQGLTQLVGSMFSLIGIVIAMLLLAPELALVCFLIIPAMLLTTSFFSRRARKAFRQARETIGDVTAGLQEEIVGVRQAQAFNRTETNIERFRARNAANRSANVQAVAITSAFSPAIDMLSSIATALVIGYGGYLVFHDALTVGLLAAFLIYVQQFFRPIQLASQVYTQAQAGLAGAERIYGILDETPEPPDALAAAPLGSLAGRIDFDHVTFAYVGDQAVLHDVSFHVEPGQTVALVGRTGAGKTTIANLIPRFYDVTEGAVLVDGHDVRQVERESLRRQIGMVLQEPFLFTGTVAENIRYGRPEATRAEIEAAAQAVAADDFIHLLPQGYDTLIGVGGASVSQGQRQLLSFARAVLADPRILILDEATSNIDTRTEQIIQRALATLLAGRTSIVIAHRLSTIRDADLILVIEGGRIIERGNHEELLAQEGRYAELYRRQFRETPAGQPEAVAS